MKTITTENQSGLPLTAIVTIVEYLRDEREHFEQMQCDGEDITDPPHIYLSIKAVTDWLDSLWIIPQSDGTFDVVHIEDMAEGEAAS
jgi:hypothetical protein